MTFEASKNIACAASVSPVLIEKVFFALTPTFTLKLESLETLAMQAYKTN